jgi:two-component system, cell cycle response regulator
VHTDPKSLWIPRLSNAPAVVDRSATMLVVCKDPDTRQHLRELLNAEGCDPMLVDTYDELKVIAEKKRPDLIFLELEPTAEPMVDLCVELRAMDSTRDVPIILVSDAPASEELVAGGLLAGADDYVAARERPTELRARVRVQLRNKRYRDALQRVRGEREAFRRQAAVDPLTGLLNRGSLSDLISDKVISGEPFAVLFIDIDHFKSINDRFGHGAGDLVLKGVADYLKDGMRSGDDCGRYGGEEFVVVASDVSPERAYRLAERHRSAIAALSSEDVAYPSEVTVSIGVAVFEPEGGETSQDLLERSDAALYAAKSSGRNRVVVARAPETPSVRPPGHLASGFHERFFARHDDAKTR